MKTLKSLILIFVVFAIAAAVLQSSKSADAPWEIDLSPNVNATQLCYIWNTEAGDKAMLSMDIRGERVIGEFYFLPFEKDSKTGIFKGDVISFSSDKNKWGVNALWEAEGEGMVISEEFWIVVEGSVAHPGFGEMKDRGDGVYVYADPENIYYGPNLQETDCGDEAMD